MITVGPARWGLFVLAGALVACGVPGSARAQALGIPMVPMTDPAMLISGGVTYGAVATGDHQGGNALAVHGSAGFAGFEVTGFISHFASAAHGGGLSPALSIAKVLCSDTTASSWMVVAQVGFGGTARWRSTAFHIPLELGVGHTLPLNRYHVSAIKPWIAPQLDIVPNVRQVLRPGVGVGIDARCFGGVGLRAAYQILWTGRGHHEGTLGVGVLLSSPVHLDEVFKCSGAPAPDTMHPPPPDAPSDAGTNPPPIPAKRGGYCK